MFISILGFIIAILHGRRCVYFVISTDVISCFCFNYLMKLIMRIFLVNTTLISIYIHIFMLEHLLFVPYLFLANLTDPFGGFILLLQNVIVLYNLKKIMIFMSFFTNIY